MPYKKEKKFLELPRYSGGRQALSKFIRQNLNYPDEALAARIEGKVVVGFDVDDNGVVHNTHVVHGIGYGCDEEALRIVKLLRYQKVSNRGRRVLLHSKLNIRFSFPEKSMPQYIIKTKTIKSKTTTEPKKITYNINIS
ncbi:MAG: energy transducer TonB [Bacteroidales bacterium]|jgi:protein TonB|nr:energy transducer TonB [Bacteroidales bacterium]HOI32730.1 energy transducer TonB [Bacteroidales bacterium]